MDSAYGKAIRQQMSDLNRIKTAKPPIYQGFGERSELLWAGLPARQIWRFAGCQKTFQGFTRLWSILSQSLAVKPASLMLPKSM